MGQASLEIQVKSLKAQLAVLEAEVRRNSLAPVRTLADLCGVLKGKTISSEEDIEKAKYSFPWDGETLR